MSQQSSALPNPNGWLPPQRFVEGFVAKLVTDGWRSLSTRDPATRRALSAVVAKFDEWIDAFEKGQVDWDAVAPWVQTANSLRPSSLGGVENWEHQFRLGQGFLVRVPNPDYAIVDFSITPNVARFELAQFTPEQREVIDLAYRAFTEHSRQFA